MKISRRDWLFAGVIVAVICALYAGKSRRTAGDVPFDDKHARFYEDSSTGGDRKEAEKGCAACHGIQNIPLSKGHPPKEQCLICHKLARTKK